MDARTIRDQAAGYQKEIRVLKARAEAAESRLVGLEAKVLVYESDSNASYMAGKSFMRGQLEPRLAQVEAERDDCARRLAYYETAVTVGLAGSWQYIENASPTPAISEERVADVLRERDAERALTARLVEALEACERKLEEIAGSFGWADSTIEAIKARDALAAVRERKD